MAKSIENMSAEELNAYIAKRDANIKEEKARKERAKRAKLKAERKKAAEAKAALGAKLVDAFDAAGISRKDAWAFVSAVPYLKSTFHDGHTVLAWLTAQVPPKQ